MHLRGVLRSFADLGSAKQFFWSWLDLLICSRIAWVLTNLDCLSWGDWHDLTLFCVTLILHQANTDMFSWRWQGTRTSGNSSTFWVSACITFVNIPSAKADHKAETRIGVGEQAL